MPLEPITRSEQFYSRIAGESGAVLEPVTRKEHFLARIAGDADAKVLEPKTRTEQFLQQIIDSGGGGGGEITVEALTATENGVYTAPTGKAYTPVTVAVPVPPEVDVEPLSVTENGTYTAPSGKAYSPVTVNVPSGGGGAQLIASGTFTGDGSVPPEIPVGKRMPKTDFIFNVWVDDDTEITPSSNTNRAYVWAQIVVQKKFGEYDLSTNGQKAIISKLSYPTVNTSTGVTTERTPTPGQASAGGFTRWTAAAVEIMMATQVIRDESGFSVKPVKGNDYTTVSGVTYNWELLYIGSSAATDIVEVP